MEWQLIETAPKNNQEIIVYAPKESPSVFTAIFIAPHYLRSSSNRYAPNDDFYGDDPIKVTHWMPLPEPPK